MSGLVPVPSVESLAERLPVDLAAFRQLLLDPPISPSESCHPIILKLEPGESNAFRSLCEAFSVTVIDSFERQLMDLAAARIPGAGAAEHREYAEEKVVGAGDWNSCGTWVLLPWENKVVHLLDSDDYFEVITNRNRNKITLLEQQVLRTKTIGVMGLSLGAEAAVTAAQEHLCGRIRLADFDRLDLSNLNRINAGCDDLGVRKTTLAARRIAKIDPYIPVTLFEEGVTSDNAAAFLKGLDLLMEECDGLSVKFQVRLHARALGLNIVFAGDERGFLSIEPHAHDPELRAFHGLIEEPQLPRERYPDSQAFLTELAKWLGGWEQLSERTRESLGQIGESLCGYPQLASEARYAAAQLVHVARRLLLGERLPAFVGHLDLQDLIPRAGAPATARAGMPE